MSLPIIFNGRSGSQIDIDLNEELAAQAAAIATKLSEDLATEITTTKPAPVGADRTVLLDSAAGDVPVLSTLAQIFAGQGLNSLGDVVLAAPATGQVLKYNGASWVNDADATGGGGAGAALGLWDYWHAARFANGVTSPSSVFSGIAMSSGTNNLSAGAATLFGYNNGGVLLRSSTTANSGYRYTSSPNTTFIFGGGFGDTFRAQAQFVDSFTDTTVRVGFHDATSSSDAADGAYFEIVAGVCSAKTAATSTRTTNATTLALTLGVNYTFDIEVNAAGTAARFRVYAGTSTTPVLDVTNTTNLPAGTSQSFGAALVATNSGTTAVNLCILYSLGVGTIAGLARALG